MNVGMSLADLATAMRGCPLRLGCDGEMALTPRFRERMEDAFRARFSNVSLRRVFQFRGALRGAFAATAANGITLSRSYFALGPRSQEWVLAHELAHVVQKALPHPWDGGIPSEAHRAVLLEAEANAAASAALAGRPARCKTPDAPARPAPWGPAGHYYTSLFVMLAAGMEYDKAKRRAFFCQMPDEVFEFDATSADIDFIARNVEFGLNFGKKTLAAGEVSMLQNVRWASRTLFDLNYSYMPGSFTFSGATFYRATDTRFRPHAESRAENAARMMQDLEVSLGLHSLSGGNANAEIAFRKQTLIDTKDDDLSFGLALHAFGDAYAHEDLAEPGRMYPQILGHAIDRVDSRNTEAVTQYDRSDEYRYGTEQQRKMLQDEAQAQVNMHETDDVANPAHRWLYMRYVRDLYRIIVKCDPSLKPALRSSTGYPGARTAEDEVVRLMTEVANHPFTVHDHDDERQRKTSEDIKRIAGASLIRAPQFEYAPEAVDSEKYWHDFIYTDAALNYLVRYRTEYVYQRVFELAHQWYVARMSWPDIRNQTLMYL